MQANQEQLHQQADALYEQYGKPLELGHFAFKIGQRAVATWK